MNTRLDGLAVEDINLGLIAAVKQEAGIHSEIIGNVIDAAAESITADDDLQIYTSGTMNIFKYPELTDSAKASELISTFEDTRDLSSIVEDTLSADGEETGIRLSAQHDRSDVREHWEAIQQLLAGRERPSTAAPCRPPFGSSTPMQYPVR